MMCVLLLVFVLVRTLVCELMVALVLMVLVLSVLALTLPLWLVLALVVCGVGVDCGVGDGVGVCVYIGVFCIGVVRVGGGVDMDFVGVGCRVGVAIVCIGEWADSDCVGSVGCAYDGVGVYMYVGVGNIGVCVV